MGIALPGFLVGFYPPRRLPTCCLGLPADVQRKVDVSPRIGATFAQISPLACLFVRESLKPFWLAEGKNHTARFFCFLWVSMHPRASTLNIQGVRTPRSVLLPSDVCIGVWCTPTGRPTCGRCTSSWTACVSPYSRSWDWRLLRMERGPLRVFQVAAEGKGVKLLESTVETLRLFPEGTGASLRLKSMRWCLGQS